jgi:CheY-like chemotaxis protein
MDPFSPDRPAAQPRADDFVARSVMDRSRGHDWRLGRFPDLMQRRIEEILLVATQYDAFVLEEDGLLTELIFSEYVDLGLAQGPRVTRVSTGEEALRAIRERNFDLVVTMLHLEDMDVSAFRRAVRQVRDDLAVALLVASEAELRRLPERLDWDASSVYLWEGDARIFLAIIKVLEDRWNVEADTSNGGVGVIILLEDSVRYRSTLLPIMYDELVRQTRSVMAEGLNPMQRLLRLRARPKILMADTYEQGLDLYQRYRDAIFGVIADVSFSRGGAVNPLAGVAFIRAIKRDNPDVPALLQSSDARNQSWADELHTGFLHKHSDTLLADVSAFMLRDLSFGDFVFRLPDGTEVARASDLRSMSRLLGEVPAESLEYHARRNHFSNWLRARTEFVLARRMRPRSVSEFRDLTALRQYLVHAFEEAVRHNRRGIVEDFSRERFDPGTRFARIGGGSLGGKARGLAFFDALLARQPLEHAFPGVRVYVPPSVVIGTSVFDDFLRRSGLRGDDLADASESWVGQTFLRAELPTALVNDLRAFLETARYPIAVRSSSLLEDSPYYPFAGVYATHMLPNNHAEMSVRLWQLCEAVKLVYASTFFQSARAYFETTPHQFEAQKMAVIIQQLVGAQHDRFFYPQAAGVVRSYNFYPFGDMRPEDGVAYAVLGLGKTVAEGGDALRFCPAHPQILPQLAGPRFLDQSQRGFYALDLGRSELAPSAGEDAAIVRLPLEVAEAHGTLAAVGSVWSSEDQAFHDGIYRAGVRAVTFAHMLKSDLFPLASTLNRLLALGRQGIGGPVEIEFAIELETPVPELAVLQLRPYAVAGSAQPVNVDASAGAALCYSGCALGHGVIDGLRDVVYVKPDSFEASFTGQIARELARLNEGLRAERRDFVLIGPGRWGSSNPWLGIPVSWAQISGARVIVEAALQHWVVDPSQGSHFFHNLTSVGAAYLTVNPRAGAGFVDWQWLARQPATNETHFVRHVRLAQPLQARVDGRSSRGAILRATGADQAATAT